VASEPRLASRVYVPKVYPALSTKKIMTAEFISGVALSDRPAIRRLMGVDPSSPSSPPPLTGGLRSVMETMVSLFSAQIFSFGWVHCDPHPGNIIIRPNPRKPTEAQLVLLDHGLYVGLTDEFKRQYALLWRGLLTVDWEAIEGVAREWGIGTPDLFASATLMRPVKRANRNGNGEDWEGLSEYERSVKMKAKLKGFLTDTDKMPKELIFLGRNMRYTYSLFLNCRAILHMSLYPAWSRAITNPSPLP
jgi:aarF domain-containing kinase